MQYDKKLNEISKLMVVTSVFKTNFLTSQLRTFLCLTNTIHSTVNQKLRLKSKLCFSLSSVFHTMQKKVDHFFFLILAKVAKTRSRINKSGVNLYGCAIFFHFQEKKVLSSVLELLNLSQFSNRT